MLYNGAHGHQKTFRSSEAFESESPAGPLAVNKSFTHTHHTHSLTLLLQ